MPIRAILEAEAERQLAGRGDPALGEWREWSGRVFHLRRRLSVAEWAHVGPAVDIRGSAEAWQWVAMIPEHLLRYAAPEVLADELRTESP